MPRVANITPAQKQELDELHLDFEKQAKRAGYSAAAAAFLLISALIVITCGCLCLMLPGVNVITQVILPAVIPGLLAIVVSIPFILLAVKYQRVMDYFREKMINQMISHLDNHKVDVWDRKKRIHFILHNFLNWQYDDSDRLLKNTDWTEDYQSKILNDIKEKIGKSKKKRNPRQEKIAMALDNALARIKKKKLADRL